MDLRGGGMKQKGRGCRGVCAALVGMLVTLAGAHAEESSEGVSREQVMEKAGLFFGETTEGLAKAVEKVFAEQGEPNAIIVGEEVSAALGDGVRYGRGELQTPGGGGRAGVWQGDGESGVWGKRVGGRGVVCGGGGVV